MLHNVVCQLPGKASGNWREVTCACVAKKISVFFLLGRFSKSPPRLAAAALLSSRTFMVSGIYSSDFGGRDAAYLMTRAVVFISLFDCSLQSTCGADVSGSGAVN